MAELVSALVVAILFAIVAILVLPILLIISFRQSGAGFGLRVTVGPFFGLLRFRVLAISVEPACANEAVMRLTDVASKILRSATGLAEMALAGKSGNIRPSLRRRISSMIVDAAAHSVGKPGYCCTRLEIRGQIGLNEASSTAMAIGLIHAGLAMSSSLLWSLIRFERGSSPRVDVSPSYESPRTDATVDCIFRISLGYIIRREAARLLHRRFASGKVA